jgi:UDP-N-acetylmuramate--alanine ligase
MSAIASVLSAMGHRVTGSDLKASPALDRLAASGVEVQVGHDGTLMADAEILSVSTAVPDDNFEVRLASSRGLRIATRAETLAAICACRRVVAVSGTHGKTTTTTLVSLVLVEAGWHP